MVQIPDNVKPVLAIFAKYHFWMLAVLAPLILLPLLFSSNARLQAEIKSTQGQIRSRFDALRQVQGVAPHPNQGWSKDIDEGAKLIRLETLAEWKAFWDSQAFLRQWPKELGDDFLAAVKDLKPGDKLDRNMLQRYQNRIQEIVKKLPARLKADDMMDGAGDPRPQPAGRPAGQAKRKSLCQWAAGDQKRLLDSFAWRELPSTVRVVLAQEELWVQGVLSDIVADINAKATGAHDVPIPRIDELAVGYPAAEEQPGGLGGKRILLPAQPAAPDAGNTSAGGDSKKPAHPRFSAKGDIQTSRQPADQAGSPDDPLREWIYVDFSGKPLSAAELATNPAAQMVHLMPFVMKFVIDEQKLDALLVALATASLPIDVRQVRINASGASADSVDPASGGAGAASGGRRPRDIAVEIRGTVGLATPPSPKLIGLEPQPSASGEQPPAASTDMSHGRKAA